MIHNVPRSHTIPHRQVVRDDAMPQDRGGHRLEVEKAAGTAGWKRAHGAPVQGVFLSGDTVRRGRKSELARLYQTSPVTVSILYIKEEAPWPSMSARSSLYRPTCDSCLGGPGGAWATSSPTHTPMIKQAMNAIHVLFISFTFRDRVEYGGKPRSILSSLNDTQHRRRSRHRQRPGD